MIPLDQRNLRFFGGFQATTGADLPPLEIKKINPPPYGLNPMCALFILAITV